MISQRAEAQNPWHYMSSSRPILSCYSNYKLKHQSPRRRQVRRPATVLNCAPALPLQGSLPLLQQHPGGSKPPSRMSTPWSPDTHMGTQGRVTIPTTPSGLHRKPNSMASHQGISENKRQFVSRLRKWTETNGWATRRYVCDHLVERYVAPPPAKQGFPESEYGSDGGARDDTAPAAFNADAWADAFDSDDEED